MNKYNGIPRETIIFLALAISLGGSLHLLFDLLEEGESLAPFLLGGALLSCLLLPLVWRVLPKVSERDEASELVKLHGYHLAGDALLTAVSAINPIVFAGALLRVLAHEVVLAPLMLGLAGRNQYRRYLAVLVSALLTGSILGFIGARYEWFIHFASLVVMLLPALAITRFRGQLTEFWSENTMTRKVMAAILMTATITAIVLFAHLLHGE